jgi:hypothetical protein
MYVLGVLFLLAFRSQGVARFDASEMGKTKGQLLCASLCSKNFICFTELIFLTTLMPPILQI